MCILLRIGIMLLSASSSDQSPTIVSLQPGSEAECLTVAVVHVADEVTARLDLILIVAAFLVIASLQVLVFLNEIRDECLSLPIGLAESLEALKVACGRRVAIVAVHRCRDYRAAFSSSFNAVCDVGQASFQQTLDGRKSKSRGGRI